MRIFTNIGRWTGRYYVWEIRRAHDHHDNETNANEDDGDRLLREERELDIGRL